MKRRIPRGIHDNENLQTHQIHTMEDKPGMPEQQLILDRYRIVGRAGAGGYATVQHAFDTRLKRDVAIKCIQLSQTQAVKARVSVNGAAAARPFDEPDYGESVLDIIGAASIGMHEDAASPDLPHDPGFLNKREERLARQAQRRAVKAGRTRIYDTNISTLPSRKLGDYGRSGYGNDPLAYPFDDKIGAPRNTIHLPGAASYAANNRQCGAHRDYDDEALPWERSANNRVRYADETSVDSVDIARLASVLPGSISGAGHTEIAGIDGDAVEVDIVEEASDKTGYRAPVAPYGGYDERDFEDPYRSSCDQGGDYDYEDTYAKTTPLMGGVRSPKLKSHSERSGEPGHSPAARTPSKVESPGQPSPVTTSSDAIPGLEEARTAAHLNDANIVTVYDCVVEGTMAYVIMEYVEGKTLARMMREMENDITLDMITSVFLSVSHALEVAHKAGVLHLDIKPENVIINRDGLVKVADFGLSTLMDASGRGTTGGGTIGYMPLEQMRQQPLDVRTDEWALASLTYEMLSGANPFRARTLEGAEAAIENAELVLPSRFWDIDEEIDDILFAALDPDLDERYDTIQDFADDLAPYLGNAKDGKKQLAEIVVNGIGEDDGEGRDAREEAAYNDYGNGRGASSERHLAPKTGRGILSGLFSGRRGSIKEEHAPKSAGRTVYGMSFEERFAERGLAITVRVVAALSAAMVAAISLMNFRLGFNEGASALSAQAYSATYGDASLFGLFTVAPLVAWVLMAAFVAVSFIWPRFGMPLVYLVLVVSLLFNQAWTSAFLLLFATGIWWWLLGRKSDRDCSVVMMQPLFGSFGFAALVAPVAGALLDIRESAGACFMAAVGAIVFASFGSCDVMGWEIWSNFVVAVNPSIAGASIMDGLARTLSDPSTWAIVASWILGAGAYSLFCWRGTRTFDIMGSLVCAAFIILGVVFAPLILGTNEPLSPMRIAGSLIPAPIGVLLAFAGIPDAVRTEYEDYDSEEE